MSGVAGAPDDGALGYPGSGGGQIPPADVYWDISMAFSVYQNGKWSAKKLCTTSQNCLNVPSNLRRPATLRKEQDQDNSAG